jgi:general secretion pathway protein H
MPIPLQVMDPMRRVKGRNPETGKAWDPPRGFTLLEVILVLLLATIMMGMGIIAFANRLPAAKLDATAREMSSLMKYARLQAKIQGEAQTVVIDLNARTYGIEGVKMRRIPEEVHIEIEELSSGKVNDGIYRLLFSPLGSTDAPVLSLSAGLKSVSLKPDPVTGVQISRKKKA